MFNNFFNRFSKKTEEVKEEDKRLNENDFKGHLRKFVPDDEISSGDEWERYGEDSDNPEDEEKAKYESVLTSDSPLEDHEEAFLNSLKEETENSIEVNEKLIEEERQKLFSQFVKDEENKNGFTKIENLKKDFIPEYRQEKINIKEERKIQTTMSPLKRVSSQQDVRKELWPRSKKDNLKTMNDKKKERVTRAKIAKILDSQQG